MALACIWQSQNSGISGRKIDFFCSFFVFKFNWIHFKRISTIDPLARLMMSTWSGLCLTQWNRESCQECLPSSILCLRAHWLRFPAAKCSRSWCPTIIRALIMAFCTCRVLALSLPCSPHHHYRFPSFLPSAKARIFCVDLRWFVCFPGVSSRCKFHEVFLFCFPFSTLSLFSPSQDLFCVVFVRTLLMLTRAQTN